MTNYDKYIRSTGTHYISNSGHDENGKYHGGKAGDQSDEWTLRSWYNRPWSCVLRWNDQDAAELAAQLAIEAAQNNKIGYDQYQRKTFWTALEAANYRPANITAACESDCTAGITSIWKAVGNLLGISKLKSLDIGIYSGNMRTAFKNAGFAVLTASKYRAGHDYLLPGDVLLYEGHHAATNVTLGKKAGTWNPNGGSEPVAPEIEGLPTVIVTGDSVNVRTGPSTKYESVAVARKGDMLTYQGEKSEDGLWYLVVYKNQNVWISTKYSTVNEQRVIVTGETVHIRSESNASSKSLGYVHKNDIFAYSGESANNWFKVLYKDRNGWISEKYAKLI